VSSKTVTQLLQLIRTGSVQATKDEAVDITEVGGLLNRETLEIKMHSFQAMQFLQIISINPVLVSVIASPSPEHKVDQVEGFLCSNCGIVMKNERALVNHMESHTKGRKKSKGTKIRVSRNHNERKRRSFKCSPFSRKVISAHPFSSEIKYPKGDYHRSNAVKRSLFSSLCAKRLKAIEQSHTESQNCIPQARICITLNAEKIDENPVNQNYIELENSVPLELPAPKDDQFIDPKMHEEEIKTFVSKNSKFLWSLVQALKLEKSQFDVKKFGSIFVNLSEAMISGALQSDQLCYKIAASMARLKNSQSNAMLYTAEEYEYWEYFNYLHQEASLRDLIGKKGFGLEKSGEVGSQDPRDLEFNLAIPSRTERQKHNKHKRVNLTPGVIKESLDLLKMEPQMKNLNLSIDEKHLSGGMDLSINGDEIVITGDQEYFGTASTNKVEDIENLKHGLELLESLETEAASGSFSTSYILLEINKLLFHFESSLNAKHIQSTTALSKLRSKMRLNRVNIAKEVSELSKTEKTVNELRELKTCLSESIVEEKVSTKAYKQLKLLRNYDDLLKSEEANDENILRKVDGNMMYISTSSDYWRDNIDFTRTIPTQELGLVLGLETLKKANETAKIYFQSSQIPHEKLQNTELYYKTMPPLAQALFMLNSDWEIYETGTFITSIDVTIKLAAVGGSLIRNKTNYELECTHIVVEEFNEIAILDVLSRMMIFNCHLGAITFLDEGKNLKLITVEKNAKLEHIWNISLEILKEIYRKPMIRKVTEDMKKLKMLLRTDNFTDQLKIITLFPMNDKSDYLEMEFDPNSIFSSPCVKISELENLEDEIQKFVFRCRDAFKDSTLLLRPPAGQLLLFSVNSINGRTSVSDRDDLITHYSRTGKGTQILRDVRPQIDEAIDDIEESTNSRIVTFAADTAFHSLIDYTRDLKPKNIICLQYEVFKSCKKNNPVKNLDIIKNHIEGQEFSSLDIPFTWTDKKRGVYKKPNHQIFPNLGDREMEQEMKRMNFQINPLLELPSANNSEKEPNDSDSESNDSDIEEPELNKIFPHQHNCTIPNLLSLKESAEKALLKNKKLLEIVSAQLLFSVKYEEYKLRVPISDQLVLPGLEKPLDLIASPEISAAKGHLRSSFIDLTHSGTRLRANATSRDILMARSSVFFYIAKEGSTALKVTHVSDRCDMMSEDICRVNILVKMNMKFKIQSLQIFFSVQVEARMRVISNLLEDDQKYALAEDFSDTADSCRLIRLYLESFLTPGVSAKERLTCMSYVLGHLRSMYNPWSMPPGRDIVPI
jgi:hypothetical protein